MQLFPAPISAPRVVVRATIDAFTGQPPARLSDPNLTGVYL